MLLRQLLVPLLALPARADSVPNTTRLTSLVGWDGHSFFLNGSRIFLQSGEFHTWRLPVPAFWVDVVQKVKAAGMNAISIYTHWALVNPKAGVIDMEGINALQPLFDACKEAGVWVIARPGPYINAETTGGAVPGHVLTLPNRNTWFPYNGEMRSNDTLFHNAWKDYITAVGKIIAENQITRGGPVIMLQIENEYYNGPGISEYFEQLTQTYRDLGIEVPTTTNDPGMYRNLVDDANIYGFDAYPVSFNCSNPTAWHDIVPTSTYRDYHAAVFPDEPFFIPEYQGGAFDKWASTGHGYDGCHELTNVNFQRIFYHQLWASGVTAVNFYMVYGGTNWGQLAYPAAYTSYDYSAAITETRILTDKYSELKLQSMFLRNFAGLRKTVFVGEDNTTHAGVNTTHLRNPDTGASFFINRHQNASDTDTKSFTLDIGSGLKVPQLGGGIVINGRDSLVTVVGHAFGSHSTLLYSTAPLYAQFSQQNQDVLVAYGVTGQTYEIALAYAHAPAVSVQGTTKLQSKFTKSGMILNFRFGQGISAISLMSSGPSALLIIADYDTVTRFWMPTRPSAGGGALAHFVDLGAPADVLVAGPYLVRNASLEARTLALWGDLDKNETATAIVVFAPASVAEVTWNGARVQLTRNTWGALEGALRGAVKGWQIPDLMGPQIVWRYRDSLPEVDPAFSEEQQARSGMVDAGKTRTTNPFPPFYGGPWVLYGSDYGFHSGNLIWRGTFKHSVGSPVPTAVNISVSGGSNFAASIWLNDIYLGPSDGLGTMTNNESFSITENMLRAGDNYVTVLQDHMGHNLAGQIVCCTPGGRQFDIQMPRGIQGYYLLGRNVTDQFTNWKVAGNFKGEDAPDRTRKILNEGGLYAERMGWHLPGFDDFEWEKRTPWVGIAKPGVGWFRATFNLSILEGHDVPLAFRFADVAGHYRAQLYVNGWQLGKRVGNLGPQVVFPAHEGILDYAGENTVAISLWALGNATQDLKIPSLELIEMGVYSGGVGRIPVENPGLAELRS